MTYGQPHLQPNICEFIVGSSVSDDFLYTKCNESNDLASPDFPFHLPVAATGLICVFFCKFLNNNNYS